MNNIEILKYIEKRIEEIYPEILSIRREIHMNPELSQEEVETEALICRYLDKLGIKYDKGVAGNGVVATIYGKNKDIAVGIRADIDALPITEEADTPYKSKKTGVMHACGHDVHTAILLGTAKILQEIKDDLKGSVKLFFQPAEETIGGAKQMIDWGCLENPKVEYVLGLHVDPAYPTGEISFSPGNVNAASCEFYVTINGKSCHGAHPSDGSGALLPACAIVNNLQTIVTQKIPPTEAALITVGQIHSGTKNNIIPGEAKLSGIIRTFSLENRSFIKEHIKTMSEAIAKSYDTEAIVEFVDSYPPLINDKNLIKWFNEAALEVMDESKVHCVDDPSLGADDFSYFCLHSKGLYYNIGTGNADGSDFYPVHSEFFNPNEESIKTGILTEIAGVIKILEKAYPEI